MNPARSEIRRAFERAAGSYDGAADLQRLACERLIDGLPETLTPANFLDAGCGTGYALRLLAARFPEATALGLDLAPAMLQRARAAQCVSGRPLTGVAGDIEALPLAAQSFDLYASSLSLQWCDPRRALAEARRVLRPGGLLAVATLGSETFLEMRVAFGAADRYAHTIAFTGQEMLALAARRAGFANIVIRRQPQITHHADLKTLMRSVKAIGANQIGSGRRAGLMGKATWQQVEAAYEKLRQPAGLPLNYDLYYLYATA